MAAPRPSWTVVAALSVGLLSMSVSAILVRMAGDVPGLAVAVWRTGWAALLLWPVAWPRVGPELRRLEGKDWLLIAGAAGLLGLHFITWIESLAHTSVASASVLVTTSPLFVAVLGYAFLRERLSKRMVGAIVLGVVGAALMGLSDARTGVFPRATWGNTLALVASVLVAGYLLVGRVVRQRVSFLAYLLPLYTLVFGVALAAAWLAGTPLWHGYGLVGWGFLMALFPQLIGHGSFNYAVRYVPAALLGLLSLTEPLLASLYALVLFQEVPAQLALAGMALVLLAMGWVFVRRRP